MNSTFNPRNNSNGVINENIEALDERLFEEEIHLNEINESENSDSL